MDSEHHDFKAKLWVWKGDTFVTERNVDTLIKRVRKKIESRAASPELILTVWGAGYKAVEPS